LRRYIPEEKAQRKEEGLPDKDIEEFDTGGWELIHKAERCRLNR
jgi:hypothetical protein